MKEYTTKEMRLLKSNPYTFKVTKNKLYFTVEFKEAFWIGYQAGTSPRKLLSELGYDTEIFGQKQIDSIVQRIKKQAASACGFTEGENHVRRTKRIQTDIPESSAEFMKYIWNEVKYLRQEVEFLKKIVKLKNVKKEKS